MDPNEALKNARATLALLRATFDDGRDDELVEPALTLADAFEALDGWLSNGGFSPTAWANQKQDYQAGWRDALIDRSESAEVPE
jgi:hypothetical protein